MDEQNVDARGDLAGEIAALHARLLRFARSLTRDSDAAADLAQETITRALAARWRFQPGTNLEAWLFRIMRNTYLNAVRDTTTRGRLVPLDELTGEPTGFRASALSPVEADVLARADLRRVGEAYRTLPTAFAIPLYLSAVEELSYAEVATILDLPVGTVMSRIYRARRRLMARLAENDS